MLQHDQIPLAVPELAELVEARRYGVQQRIANRGLVVREEPYPPDTSEDLLPLSGRAKSA